MVKETLLSLRFKEMIESNNFVQADILYERMVNDNLDDDETSQVMGLWYRQQKEYTKAINAFERARIKNNTLAEEIYYEEAVLYWELEYFEECKAKLEECFKINPNFSEAIYMYAEVLTVLEDVENAAIYYKKVLQIETNDVQLCINIATELSNIGYKDDAIQIHNYALLIDENNYYIYSNLAVEYAELEDFDTALFYHFKAIKLNNFCSDLWYNLACTYSLMDKVDKGIEALSTSINLDKSNIDYALEDEELINLHKSNKFWSLVLKNN